MIGRWAQMVPLVLLLGPGSGHAGGVHPDTVVVVVNPKNGLKSISQAELRAIFLMRTRRWVGGQPIVLFNSMAKGRLRKHFDRTVLGFTPLQTATYWVDFRIRGAGSAPRIVPSSRLLRRIVSRHPEAIGYMRMGDVGPGVRILPIDGRSPDHKKYPLGRLPPVRP